MSERLSALSIRRPVLNIGRQHIDGLKGRLIDDLARITPVPEEAVDKIFVSGIPYSQIIARGEFLRMQRRLGRDRLDESEVQTLSGQLREALADSPRLEVSTLPVLMQHWGQHPKLALRVAYSEAVSSERWLAREIIDNFLQERTDTVPPSWYISAKKVVPVQLANSETVGELRMLNRLSAIIKAEVPHPAPNSRPLLPATTWLNEPKVTVS